MIFESAKKEMLRGKHIRHSAWKPGKYWYWDKGILCCASPYMGEATMTHYRVPPEHLEKDRLATDWEVL